MSSLQQKLENVDARTKEIVIGFIRLSYKMVPVDIINLCILFYALCESFDQRGKFLYISASENGMKDAIVEQKHKECAQTVLGSFVIDAEQLGQSVIQWTFKIYPISIKDWFRSIMYFGIVDGSPKSIMNLIQFDTYVFAPNRKYRNYGWRFENYRRSGSQMIGQQSHTFKDNYGPAGNSEYTVLETGDDKVNMIELVLDIPRKSLMVIVNDKKDALNVIGKYENVDMSGFYRMALSFRQPGSKVEIVDFQINQQ